MKKYKVVFRVNAYDEIIDADSYTWSTGQITFYTFDKSARTHEQIATYSDQAVMFVKLLTQEDMLHIKPGQEKV